MLTRSRVVRGEAREKRGSPSRLHREMALTVPVGSGLAAEAEAERRGFNFPVSDMLTGTDAIAAGEAVIARGETVEANPGETVDGNVEIARSQADRANQRADVAAFAGAVVEVNA